MDIHLLRAYLPQDRLHALASGTTLPNRTYGASLFADISGFTALTEGLRNSFGTRRGAEELTQYLDAVYNAFITEVEQYRGSVVGFAGDAITCWFDESAGMAERRAATCAFALQRAMHAFQTITLPNSQVHALTLKVAVASGPARRFVVGDPAIHYTDVLAGATVDRTALADHLMQRGEIMFDEATVTCLGAALEVREWRSDAANHERFAVVTGYADPVNMSAPLPPPDLSVEQLEDWVHKYQLERAPSFLAEFRPCAALFIRFGGIDYDSDAAESQLDRFVCHLQARASRYNAALLQLTIGDKGSYAYLNLGALSTHEDDARRAVKLAFELRQSVQMLGFEMPVQMGITLGVMRVGAYGGTTRRTYGALGDDVNLAARLMQNAAPGEVLATEAVQKAASDEFLFEPRPPLILKGKTEPVSTVALMGPLRKRALRLQEPTYVLPMVGREHALQTVYDRLALALSGQGQVIGIVAEAGMGKSRLAAEAIRWARQAGFAGYGGACQSDGVNVPYQVWKPIWTAFFNLDSTAPTQTQIQHLTDEIRRYASPRILALPLLGSLLDLDIPDNDFTRPLESKYRLSALQALLEDCLRSASQAEPLLFVLEDLHWIDALSHSLLENLGRALTDSRVCFVLAYRPPQMSRLEAPRIERLSNFTRIQLSELSHAEAERAIRAKLAILYATGPSQESDVPPLLVEKLMERAQGNPFFLEELVNFLYDRGIDPHTPDALSKIELPDNLHTLILSRIDRLSEEEKITLRVASIVGRLFRAAWLTGYYPELGQMPNVIASLDLLDEMDITPLAPTETELAYLFKHIVTHEVTYESLPFATRARLHEQLARYLERQIDAGILRKATLLDTLVFHYTRTENLDKKRAYLFEAGRAAYDTGAFSTAAEYFQQLLELTPSDDPALSGVALELALTLHRLSDTTGTQVAVQKALEAARTDRERASALALLADLTNKKGDYTGAQTILSEAVPLARLCGDQLTLCRVLYSLGALNWHQGNTEAARLAFSESLEVAMTLGDVRRELSARNALIVLHWQTQGGDATQQFQELHDRALVLGDRMTVIVSLNNLGVLADGRHDYARAHNYFEQSLKICRELGARDDLISGLLNLAEEKIKLSQIDAARADTREGLALALQIQMLPRAVHAIINFSYIAYAEGQVDRALELTGLARSHPSWGSEHQREWELAQARWALDPATIEAGLSRGAALDFDATVQALLRR